MSQKELSLSIALLLMPLRPSQIRPVIASGFSQQNEGLIVPLMSLRWHGHSMGQRPEFCEWLRKLRRPSVSRCSYFRPLAAVGREWVVTASQPTQAQGEVTAGSSIPKGCFLLFFSLLPYFPPHLVALPPLLFSSSSSSRCLHCWWGKCHYNDF